MKEEIWKYCVHNKAFDLERELDTLRICFEFLAGNKTVLNDQYIIAYQQIQLCQFQLDKLQKAISRIKFEPKPLDKPE